MPYRFPTLSALLLIPITVTAMAYTTKAMTESDRFWALSLLTGLVLLAGFFISINEHSIGVALSGT